MCYYNITIIFIHTFEHNLYFVEKILTVEINNNFD